jgi:hypothetical protein
MNGHQLMNEPQQLTPSFLGFDIKTFSLLFDDSKGVYDEWTSVSSHLFSAIHFSPIRRNQFRVCMLHFYQILITACQYIRTNVQKT